MDKTAWEKVQFARHPNRPTAKKVIEYLMDDFIELHGDRAFRDDPSIIGGIGYMDGLPVTIIAQEKGVDTNDKIKRNFGMPHPEGYEKALRLMKQAAKFKRPIIVIIDTPGAYPGLEAENRNQAFKIANNLKEMMMINTFIISVVLSEGGSGGALAIGVSDKILMFENSIYSVLSPEGFASIIYRDSSRAKDAAEVMKLQASDLFKYKIVDEIIKEKEGLHLNPEFGLKALKKSIKAYIVKDKELNADERLDKRYLKYRSIGFYGKRIDE